MDKHQVLKKYFGYDSFLSGQEGIIDDILSGSDVLAIMPTGAGKSVCYQIPALMMSGTTIVISPLISLIKDQIYALRENGIEACTLNTSLDDEESAEQYRKIKSGECKLLYVSPEKLTSSGFKNLIRKISVPFVCIDEAHCVSQWGQDFRSSYLEIASFISTFDVRPIVAAFTATATKLVREDICTLLGLTEPKQTVTGFDRKNLFFELQKPEDKFTALRRCLDTHMSGSSIVYCATRKTVNEIYERLSMLGYSVLRYHAGLTPAERNRNQNLFIHDKVRTMVATNAFGMGIDKSDVSLVVHYNMPGDIESYYQEAGRAGRDGLEADCILLYSHGDKKIREYLINYPINNENMTSEQKKRFVKRKLDMLRCMEAYCSGQECLRGMMLRYFGENVGKSCGKCSVCVGERKYTDITVSAQKVLSATARAKGSCDKNELVGLLKGKSDLGIELSRIKTFGAMSDESEEYISEVIGHLVAYGFMRAVSAEDKTLLVNTEKAKRILFEGMKLHMPCANTERRLDAKERRRREKTDLILLTSLRMLRKRIADRLSIPPLAVFTDLTLREMSAKKPVTKEEMRRITGVSEKKLEKYSELFIAEIKHYRNK